MTVSCVHLILSYPLEAGQPGAVKIEQTAQMWRLLISSYLLQGLRSLLLAQPAPYASQLFHQVEHPCFSVLLDSSRLLISS